MRRTLPAQTLAVGPADEAIAAAMKLRDMQASKARSGAGGVCTEHFMKIVEKTSVLRELHPRTVRGSMGRRGIYLRAARSCWWVNLPLSEAVQQTHVRHQRRLGVSPRSLPRGWRCSRGTTPSCTRCCHC